MGFLGVFFDRLRFVLRFTLFSVPGVFFDVLDRRLGLEFGEQVGEVTLRREQHEVPAGPHPGLQPVDQGALRLDAIADEHDGLIDGRELAEPVVRGGPQAQGLEGEAGGVARIRPREPLRSTGRHLRHRLHQHEEQADAQRQRAEGQRHRAQAALPLGHGRAPEPAASRAQARSAPMPSASARSAAPSTGAWA